MTQVNTEKKKSPWVFATLFLVLTFGFIAMAVDNLRLNNKLTQLQKDYDFVTAPPAKVERTITEGELVVKRNMFLEKCKLQKQVEFYNVVDNRLAPRTLNATDILQCHDAAFALTGDPEGDRNIENLMDDVSRARGRLFREYHGACMAEGGTELPCVKVAHDQTVIYLSK